MAEFPKDLLLQYKAATNKLRKFQRVVFKWGIEKPINSNLLRI